MFFHTYIPRLPLRRFVENLWLYQDYASPHVRERILPAGTFKLVFNLETDELRIYDPWHLVRPRRFSGAVLSRPCGEPFVTDSSEEASVLGVNFSLGGAFPFFGSSAAEPAGTHVDLESLWGLEGAELHERLSAAASPHERFELVERTLLSRLNRPRSHHPAVLAGLSTLGRPGARTREVARAAGLSERRFIAVFKAELGVRPKTFGRVQRFQRALAAMRRERTPVWASIAASCGYFDQSHMIRDFVAFAGVGPAEYWHRREQLIRQGVRVKPNHLPFSK